MAPGTLGGANQQSQHGSNNVPVIEILWKNTDFLYLWTTSCLLFQPPTAKEMLGQLTVQAKKRFKTKFSVCVFVRGVYLYVYAHTWKLELKMGGVLWSLH